MKKVLSFIISLSLMLSIFTINSATTVYATEFEKDINYFYSGTIYDSNVGNRNCELSISYISDSTFRGHLYFQSTTYTTGYNVNIPYKNGDTEIKTYIISHDDYGFTCKIDLPHEFFSTPVLYITIHPSEGSANGTLNGELATMGSIDFTMTGTTDKFYADGFPYEENDMKLCMELSYLAYQSKWNKLKRNGTDFIPKNLFNRIDDGFNSTIISYNYKEAFSIKDNEAEAAKNNVAYTVTSRENVGGTVDIFVIIRGTLNDEWVGNVEITGTEYNPKPEHDNFYKAAESIQEGICNYYDILDDFYSPDKINLIITGHSRGAAVANIYASQALREIKDNHDYYEDIPTFNKVVAYTFACPNVIKHDEINDYYGSIYNFVLSEDIVPNVPLTNPTDGWDYWKFGRVYSISKNKYINSGLKGVNTIYKNTPQCLSKGLKNWKSVNEFYNKNLYSLPTIANPLIKTTTLYDTVHSVAQIIKSKNGNVRTFGLVQFLLKFDIYPQLKPLIYSAAPVIPSVIKAHKQETYNYIINGNGNFQGCDADDFESLSYEDVTGSNRSARTNNEARRATREHYI